MRLWLAPLLLLAAAAIVQATPCGELSLTATDEIREGRTGPVPGNFTLQRTQADTTVDVTITATDGGALAGIDYTDPAGLVVVMAAGDHEADFTLTILHDELHETDETFTLVADSHFSIDPARRCEASTLDPSLQVTILDDLPVFRFEAIGAIGMVEGGHEHTITVAYRSGDLPQARVSLQVTGGSATLGSDYFLSRDTVAPFSQDTPPFTITLSSPSGGTYDTHDVTIHPLDDILADPGETVLLELQPLDGGTWEGSAPAITIDDDLVVRFEFDEFAPVVVEHADVAHVLVRRAGADGKAVSVDVTGLPFSMPPCGPPEPPGNLALEAVAGPHNFHPDYVDPFLDGPVTLHFGPTQTVASFDVTLYEDSREEGFHYPDEDGMDQGPSCVAVDFGLTAPTGPSGAVLGTNATTSLLIWDGTGDYRFTEISYVAMEGTDPFVDIFVDREFEVDEPSSVRVLPSTGADCGAPATGGEDFVHLDRRLNFPASTPPHVTVLHGSIMVTASTQPRLVVTLPILDDDVVEDTEYVCLRLVEASERGKVTGRDMARVMILDDDVDAPVEVVRFHFDRDRYDVQAGGNVTISVVRNGASEAQDITWEATLGTIAAPGAWAGNLHFPAGVDQVNVTLQVPHDTPGGSVNLALRDPPAGAALSYPSTATLTVVALEPSGAETSPTGPSPTNTTVRRIPTAWAGLALLGAAAARRSKA